MTEIRELEDIGLSPYSFFSSFFLEKEGLVH